MLSIHSARPSPTPPVSRRPAEPIDQALEDGMRSSLAYQILRRTLMPDAEPLPAATTAPADQAAPPAAEAPAAVQTTTELASVETLVEQRRLRLELNRPAAPQQSDPLVLDLAGNGFHTRGLTQAVRFDLDADGQTDLISAPQGDDALLVLDRNGNGRIDDGRELFGDQHGAAHGFAELARFDDNADGRIDAQDGVFSRLGLLRFDGRGQPLQQSLQQAGVSAIALRSEDVRLALGAYDTIAQLGRFEFADGRQGRAADLLLARRTPQT